MKKQQTNSWIKIRNRLLASRFGVAGVRMLYVICILAALLGFLSLMLYAKDHSGAQDLISLMRQ